MRLAALIVPVGLGATALAHSALTTHMAVHLCGWPATVSCDFGVPVVWRVLIAGLWTIVAVVTIDALTFIRKPKRDSAWRLLGWVVWGPTLVATTIATMQDRTLHPGDLLAGTALVAAAILLLSHTAWTRLPVSRAVMAAGFCLPLVAVLAVPAWAPAAFRAAEQAEPARRDQARRNASEECLERLTERRETDAPSGEPQPACAIYPPPGE